MRTGVFQRSFLAYAKIAASFVVIESPLGDEPDSQASKHLSFFSAKGCDHQRGRESAAATEETRGEATQCGAVQRISAQVRLTAPPKNA